MISTVETEDDASSMRKPTLSAGVVVVRFGRDGPEYLLLRAYSNWDFPKGMVEADETPFAAARREVAEETTLTALDFRWGDAHVETEPYGRGKVARYYLAATDEDAAVSLPVSAELGKPEHDEFRWLHYDAARALVSPRVRAVLEWAHAIVSRQGQRGG
jgi:bis(5'-nucleosidyl)-tetraphosphatase